MSLAPTLWDDLMVRCLVIVALLIALPAEAQVYKWTDPSGKVHYGDSPPDDAKKEELKIRIPSYDGPVQVRDWSAVLGTKPGAASSGQVTMYSTSWCGHCRNARNYFAAKRIGYREIDVEKSAEGAREFKRLGGRGVPLILVGAKAMSGFNPESFEELLSAR
jgi:glutaredoxin